MKKTLLCIVLIATMFAAACSTAWVSTLDSILAAAAPALIDILQIYALSSGKAVPAALVSKINADAAAVKSTATDFANASATAGPGACAQLQTALTTYEADLPAVLAVAQVSNVNTQNKIDTLSALVIGTFGALEPVIPGCSAPAVANLKVLVKTAAPPLKLKNFVTSYNAVLTSKTNDAPVDKATPKMKLHYHSKAVRVLTLGVAQ